MLVQSASANIASMRSQLDVTNQLFQQKQMQRQELMENIAELEKKIAGVKESGDAFTAALDSLDRQRNWVKGLEVITNDLPTTIRINNISYGGGRLTLQGRAPSEEGALSYAKSLDASGMFSEIIIASMKRIEGEEVNLTLFLKTRG